jgi:hypothetical protein
VDVIQEPDGAGVEDEAGIWLVEWLANVHANACTAAGESGAEHED